MTIKNLIEHLSTLDGESKLEFKFIPCVRFDNRKALCLFKCNYAKDFELYTVSEFISKLRHSAKTQFRSPHPVNHVFKVFKLRINSRVLMEDNDVVSEFDLKYLTIKS